MTYIPDLAEDGPLKMVGFLSRDQEYCKGESSEALFDRLASLVMVRGRTWGWGGRHECDLGSCGARQKQPESYWRGMRIPDDCSTEILVPDKTLVYIAPTLILHYIRAHRYLPPECFREAVLNCPDPDSQEYRAEIRRIQPNGFFLIQ